MLARRHALRDFLAADKGTNLAGLPARYQTAERASDWEELAQVESREFDPAKQAIRHEMLTLRKRADGCREIAREYSAEAGSLLLHQAAELEREADALEYQVVGSGAGFIARH